MENKKFADRSSLSLRRRLAYLLSLWWFFLVLEVICSFSCRQHALKSEILPSYMTGFIFSHEIALLFLSLSIASGLVLCCRRLFSLLAKVSFIPCRLMGFLTILVTVILFLLYWSSWALFRSTGQFLDYDGLKFGFNNSIMLWQHVVHMEPMTSIGVPAAAVLSTFVALKIIPQIVRKHSKRAIKLINLLGIVFLAVCLILSQVLIPALFDTNTAVTDPRVGTVYTLKDMSRILRADRLGPISHLWADVKTGLAEKKFSVQNGRDYPVQYSRIVPVKDYLSSTQTEGIGRPNIIIIIVESLRSDQLKAYGGGRSVMPSVESLSADAVVFTNHYTQSSHSNYADLCPLASQYPLRSQTAYVYPADSPFPQTLIYDILHNLDYRTAIFSSQNERWGGMLNFLQTAHLDHLLHAENFQGSTYVPRHDTGFSNFVKTSKRSGKIDDRFTVTKAIEWIKADLQKPFFIYLNLQASHVPYEVPADFPRKFGITDLPFTLRFNDFPRTAEAIQMVKDRYADSLAYVDYQLDRLFQTLKQLHLWDNSIIVLTADTGQAFYEHGFAAHANQLYNEVMQVPLIIRAPGLAPGIDNRPAQHIDIPPTLLSLLNLPAYPGFQGLNLFSGKYSAERSIFLLAQCPLAHQYAIIRGKYKYIYDYRHNQSLLYDLKEDPSETRNIAAGNQKVANELRNRLFYWRRQQLDYYGKRSLHRHFFPPFFKD
jgi:arylsulfatase A-like enzyme